MKILEATNQDFTDIPSRLFFYSVNGKSDSSAALKYYLENPEHPAYQARSDIKKWVAKNFPLTIEHLVSLEKMYNKDYQTSLIQKLMLAHQSFLKGEIEKARFTELKDSLNRVVDITTGHQADNIRKDHFEMIQRSRDTYGFSDAGLDYVHLYSLNDVKSKIKVVRKAQSKPEKYNELENFYVKERLPMLEELIVLAEMVDELKDMVVATKRREADPKRTENQGEQQTCGYCFRHIRLMPKNQTVIAYHGFVRSEYSTYMIGGSCSGAAMKPLEESHEATYRLLTNLTMAYKSSKAYIPELEKEIADTKAELEKEYVMDLKDKLIELERKLYSCKRECDMYIPDAQKQAYEMLKKFQPAALDGAKEIVRESGVEHDFLK